MRLTDLLLVLCTVVPLLAVGVVAGVVAVFHPSRARRADAFKVFERVFDMFRGR